MITAIAPMTFILNTAFNSYFISGLKTTNKKLKTKNVKNIKDFCNINVRLT